MGKRITIILGARARRAGALMRASRLTPLVFVASLPMLGALVGGGLDERRHLGFTTWRSACRVAGLDLAVLADFTRQLLPTAIAGMLLGGLIVLLIAFLARRRSGHVRLCLAAHAGCALTLPIALFICASALPAPLMFAVDAAITVAVASTLLRLTRPSSRRAPAHP